MTSKPATVEEIIALQNDRLNALEAEVQGVRTSLETLAARKPDGGVAGLRKELADGPKRLKTALAGDLRGKRGRNGKDGKPGKDGKDGRDVTPGLRRRWFRTVRGVGEGRPFQNLARTSGRP